MRNFRGTQKSRSRVSKAGGLNANEDIDSSSKKSKKKRRDPERTENAMDNGASKNQPGGTDRPDRKIKDQSIANRASRPRKQVMEPSKRKVEDDAEENKPTRKRKSNRSRKPKKSKGESARTESSSDPAILELQAMSKLHEKLLSSQRTGSTPAELLRVHQHLPLPSKNDRIDDILALGYALFLSQRYQDAHRVFDELYRALPTTAASAAPGVFLGLVQALSSLNRMDEATKFADKLLQAKPDFREGYNIKMQLLSLKNRHDEATSFLTSELKNPKVDKLFLIMLRGKAYYKMKKFASAHTDFSTVNRTAPWSMRAEVLGWLGRTERELGNNDVAASYLKRSIAQDPTQAETMYELGMSSARTL
jgi:tetratricopeptide (TPR) repeat protein